MTNRLRGSSWVASKGAECASNRSCWISGSSGSFLTTGESSTTSRRVPVQRGDCATCLHWEVKTLVDRRTALVLVNSPHNPTGAVLTEASRKELHDFCADRSVQFVCDQVFHPHYYGASVTTAATLPHATVVGDLSKALCLPG